MFTKIHETHPFYEFDSLDGLIDFCSEVKSTWGDVWYRGHARKTFLLSPSVHRADRLMLQEQALARDFVRRGASFFPNIAADNYCRWLFLMQHYGLPTRLLDWTTHLPVALRFGFEAAADTDPCIWLLNPNDLNTAAIGETAIPTETVPLAQSFCKLAFSLDPADRTPVSPLPLSLLPHNFDPRLVAQSACFTVHGTDSRPIEAILIDRGLFDEALALRLSFSPEALPHIRRRVDTIAPTRAQIFPDIGGLVAEILETLPPA